MSLAGLFVPIYIYKIFGSLTPVLAFILLIYLTELFILFPVLRFIEKKGFRWAILLGNIIHAIFYLLLIKIEVNPIFLFIAAVVRSPVTPLIWLPIHSLFVEDNDDAKIGSEAGLRMVLNRIGSIVSPLIGGLIIASFGFNTLYYTAVSLLVLSTLPLFLMKKHVRHKVSSNRDLIDTILSKRFRNYLIGFFGQSFDSEVFASVWRIYVFLVIGSFQAFGAVRSGVTIISTIMTYIAGKLADKVGHKKQLRYAVIPNALLWFVRPFVKTLKMGVLIESIDSLQGPFYGVPRITTIYDRSERSKRSPLEFFFERELALNMCRVLVFSILLVMVMLGAGYSTIFVITGFATFLVIYLTR